MRKRIGITLLGIVVIGVSAFVLVRPKPGTVEWHINKCRSAHQQMNAPARWRIYAHTAWNLVRMAEGDSFVMEQFEKREKHQRALVKLGYLEEREFVLSNRAIDDVIGEASRRLGADPRWTRSRPEFFDIRRGTNMIIIVATHDDMHVVADAIRQADVP